MFVSILYRTDDPVLDAERWEARDRRHFEFVPYDPDEEEDEDDEE